LYAALPLLVYTGHIGIALPAAIVAVLGSAYLGYVMVFRIGGPLRQLHQRRRREPAGAPAALALRTSTFACSVLPNGDAPFPGSGR